MSQNRLVLGMFASVAIAGGALLFAMLAEQSAKSTPTDNANPPAEKKNGGAEQNPGAETRNDPAPGSPESVYIGRDAGVAQQPRKINTILTTRKGDSVYQALIRYEPQSVPVTDVPGLNEVSEALQQNGVSLPSFVARIDEETEMLIHNLGEPLRSVTSYRAYVNLDGHVIGYDLAQTNGGQAQRFVGHLTKKGVKVYIFRGADLVDNREIPFQTKGTFIPVEIELLVHQLYKANKDTLKKDQPISFTIFVPGYMSTVMVLARPVGEEVIPIGDRTYDCAKYEVQAVSAQAAEGTRAKQLMWFDKREGFLMKREDLDPTMKPGEAPVTERARHDKLKDTLTQLRHLKVMPPKLPEKPFPYSFDDELMYSVRARDADLGRLRVQFLAAPPNSPGEFTSRATVNIEASSARREESAIIYYDKNWQPVQYEAQGSEKADAKSEYRISARTGEGKISIALSRQIEELPQEAGPDEKDPKDPAVVKTPDPQPKNEASGWKDPLKRVPVSDADARAQEQELDAPRISSQTMSRALEPGTFLYDFNRIELLAALAYRFPIPAVKDGKSESVFQNVGLYSIRQNRCGVLQFEIKPEPKPVLTERQKRRLNPDEREEPQLYIATSTLSMLPCRMLLTEDGRMLELSIKFGTGDVTYTLDDPIMRRRAERAQKQKLQEGPRLLRPPWW